MTKLLEPILKRAKEVALEEARVEAENMAIDAINAQQDHKGAYTVYCVVLIITPVHTRVTVSEAICMYYNDQSFIHREPALRFSLVRSSSFRILKIKSYEM